MTRPEIGSSNWGGLLNQILDVIEAKADAALEFLTGDTYDSGWRLVTVQIPDIGVWFLMTRRKGNLVQAQVMIICITPITINGLFPEGFRSSLAAKAANVLANSQVIANDLSGGLPIPTVVSMDATGGVTVTTGDNLATQTVAFSIEFDTDEAKPTDLPGTEI